MRAPSLITVALLAASCQRPPVELEQTIELRAQDDGGDAVAGTRFWIDGRALGKSGEDGRLRAGARGRPGTSVTLSVACPAAYRTAQPERTIKLAALHAAPPIRLVALCQPLTRKAALIVSTENARGAPLPILVDGEPVGQLEPDGTAHVLLRAEPHSSLRVTLDTSDRGALRPASPVQAFQVADEDGILLFEQRFERPRRRRREAAPPPPTRPYRLR